MGKSTLTDKLNSAVPEYHVCRDLHEDHNGYPGFSQGVGKV